jgi:hypothetical protein
MIDDEHLTMTIAIPIQLYLDIHVNFANIFHHRDKSFLPLIANKQCIPVIQWSLFLLSHIFLFLSISLGLRYMWIGSWFLCFLGSWFHSGVIYITTPPLPRFLHYLWPTIIHRPILHPYADNDRHPYTVVIYTHTPLSSTPIHRRRLRTRSPTQPPSPVTGDAPPRPATPIRTSLLCSYCNSEEIQSRCQFRYRDRQRLHIHCLGGSSLGSQCCWGFSYPSIWLQTVYTTDLSACSSISFASCQSPQYWNLIDIGPWW